MYTDIDRQGAVDTAIIKLEVRQFNHILKDAEKRADNLAKALDKAEQYITTLESSKEGKTVKSLVETTEEAKNTAEFWRDKCKLSDKEVSELKKQRKDIEKKTAPKLKYYVLTFMVGVVIGVMSILTA